MEAVVSQIKERLGQGWELMWGAPPLGVFLIREQYLADVETAEAICSKEETPVVYIVASLGHLDIVYGRVKPTPWRCAVATFWRRFPQSRVKEAVKTLVDYALNVDRVPIFQLNPDVLRFADLCGEYPLVCDDPVQIVSRLSTPRRQTRRTAAAVGIDVFSELVRILREKAEVDSTYVEVVRKAVEDPERLRLCYV